MLSWSTELDYEVISEKDVIESGRYLVDVGVGGVLQQ